MGTLVTWFKNTVVALGGITFVIVIHELGHLFAAYFYGVPAPIFSVGFGPKLISYMVGHTEFRLSLILLGGYVSLDPAVLAVQPYSAKMVITLAGIVINLVFGILALWGLPYFDRQVRDERDDSFLPEAYQDNAPSSLRDQVRKLFRSQDGRKQRRSDFVGPIGIFQLLVRAFQMSYAVYLYLLAIISINIGVFNLLPLSFFDGGHAVRYTIEAFAPAGLADIVMLVIVITFFVFIAVSSILRNKSE